MLLTEVSGRPRGVGGGPRIPFRPQTAPIKKKKKLIETLPTHTYGLGTTSGTFGQ